jgi:hypothetical protein
MRWDKLAEKNFRRLSIWASLVRRVHRAGKKPAQRRNQMRFMMIYKPANVKDMEAGIPPTPEHMAEMGKLIGELVQSGVMLATDGLMPSSKGARVKQADGKVVVTDGPFVETKELIGGFAIFQLQSKAEAIELTKRFLQTAGDGDVEIRQMPDNPAYARS